MLLETLVVLTGIIAAIYLISHLLSPKTLELKGGHVLVTGGSSGIGKAVAIEAVRQGASVTLLARNKTNLSEAKLEVEKFMINKSEQTVLCISIDVSKDFAAVEQAVQEAEDKLGPVDMLINSAGISIAAKFEDIPIEEFKRQMDVNYLGSVYATRSVIKTMKKQNKGRIVFVSSQAGQIGLFGYTAYSASKFALRGLAEALQMEVKPYNIYVSLSFPPDTDTPGLAKENENKPRETQLISETAGLTQPEVVAKAMIEDSKRGKFLCSIGLDGYLVAMVTAGMSPVVSIMDAIQQIALMSIFRLVSFFYLDGFDRIVKKCKLENEKNK